MLRQLLTDGNGLEVDKVRHLLVVSDAAVFAFVDTNTANAQQLPVKCCDISTDYWQNWTEMENWTGVEKWTRQKHGHGC